MAKCLNKLCSKEVAQVKGKRQRRTCSNGCRQLFYKQSREDSKGELFISVNKADYDALVKEVEGLRGDKASVPVVEVVGIGKFRDKRIGESSFEYGIEKGEWKNG